MDVLFDEYEESLQKNVRAVLESECPTSLVREMEGDSLGYPPQLWQQVADLGWVGLALPEAYGGSGDSIIHLGILFEELGRAAAPLPMLSTVVSALTIAEYGDDAQRKEILPAVANGNMLLTWAVNETDPRLRVSKLKMTATADADGYVLNGTKLFVENFESATKVLVACRTAESSASSEGMTVFIVDKASAGIHTDLLPTLSSEKEYRVTFDHVRVASHSILGRVNDGWPVVDWMLTRATALSCTMITGATGQAVERAHNYAKERTAFGRPIGAFQSIQHLCADMVIWVDGARLLAYEALWRLSEGLPAAIEVATAKAFANERCQAALRDANQIHGGLAQIKEFDQQLWYRRASAWTMKLGTTSEHRRTIAREMGIA